MTSEPVYKCWTKATDREPGPPRYSANWITSRRAWLQVFPDRLECGDWRIPATTVQAAILYKVGLAQVLVLNTQERTYQFGLNPWVRLAEHLPFAYTKERTTMRYSWFSIALRIGVGAYLLYLVLR